MYRMFGPSRVDEAPEKCFSRLRAPTKPRKNVFCAFARRRSPGKMFFVPSRVDEALEKCFSRLRAPTKGAISLQEIRPHPAQGLRRHQQVRGDIR